MNSGDELMQQGNDAADAGDHSLAAELFRRASAAGSQIGPNLGNSLLELGDVSGALLAYSNEWKAGDLDAGFNLAYVLDETGQLDKAREVYESLVSAGYSKANFNLAWTEHEEGRQDRAESLLISIADEDSIIGRKASGVLGGWYLQQGRPDAVIAPLLERDLDNPESRSDFAEVLLRTQGEDEAIRVLEVGAARGEASSLIVLGNIHWDAGRVLEAQAAYLAGAATGDRNCAENLASLEKDEGLSHQ